MQLYGRSPIWGSALVGLIVGIGAAVLSESMGPIEGIVAGTIIGAVVGFGARFFD